jgi:predicted metal-binding membrane protein
MTADQRERRRIAGALLLASAVGWTALLSGPWGEAGLAYCRSMGMTWTWPSFRALLAISPLSALALDWTLMLVAMMTPTLIAPVLHVHRRSFKSRRIRSIALFALGYAAVWMAAGVVLVTVQLMANASAPEAVWPAATAALLALVWQCSPLKQRCLNRSHNHSELAAFGLAADRDALGFGLTHGAWCVGSCWALMLLPMLLGHAHLAAMIVVTIVMIGERLEAPAPLRWRLRGPGKLMRIVIAQMRQMLPGRRGRDTATPAMASNRT